MSQAEKPNEITLEPVEQEKFFTWWYDDDIRILVRGENQDKAIKKLGDFLLDLRTKKVNFKK